MNYSDQQKVLKSMRILVDTREQPTKRAEKRYERFGCPHRRATLSYGDYTYNATFPDGKELFNPDSTIEPLCAIERKMDLDELAKCFTHRRERFVNEFERAEKNGARIFLVVENGNWENLLNGKYRSGMTPKAFVASVTTFMARYNMNLVFCKEESSGALIKDILYRDLKERLRRGEFG